MNLGRPVTDIQGIGPALGERLNAARYASIGDLIRQPVERLHEVVASTSSLEQCEAWQSMAWLLQIDALTPQWAEALVVAGIETVEELVGQELADLQTLFASAFDSGLIPDQPDDEALFAAGKEAAGIHYGSTALVLVTSESGEPIEDAQVRVGAVQAQTDANGRCRLSHLPGASAQFLSIARDGYATVLEYDFQPNADNRSFATAHRRLAIDHGDATEEPVLEEFQGDRIPSLASYQTRWENVAEADVPEGDVVRVHKQYSDAETVQVVSLFRAWQAGEMVVRQARLGITLFDDTPDNGRLFRRRDGRYQPLAGGLNATARYRAQRQTRAVLVEEANFTQLTPEAQLQRYAELYAEFRSQNQEHSHE
ncbi:MAG: DUF4332 domain-containing protein [Pseudomonadota bacterium]